MPELTQIPSTLYALFTQKEHFKNAKSYTAYEYRDENGKTLGAAGCIRFEDENGKLKKVFFQSSYKDQGKKYISGGQGMAGCLYDLDVIRHKKVIVFVEGEKCVEALKPILPEDWGATTGLGGSGNYLNINYSMLRGKDVIIWRDNDQAGLRGAMAAHTKMIQAGANILGWVKMSKDWPEKYDVADIIANNGSGEVMKCFEDLEQRNVEKKDVPVQEVAISLPFKVLGRSVADDIYFYCFQDGSIRYLDRTKFDELSALTIYNKIEFWHDFCGVNNRGSLDKTKGWAKLWGMVLDAGIYNAKMTKNIGIFKDRDKSGNPMYALNLGDSVYIEGKEYSHADVSKN
ncbi:MAG: hypothetical protein VKJ09_15655, partial [Leptolyngbya sp.]|nr:hypothetical protein [Leptolyngbya sp.]